MKEVYAIDNTENNQANYDALKESEFRHRQIVEALPIAYYTCNPEGYILYCNEAAIKLWGRKPELGKDMWCGSWRIFGKDGAPLLLEECPMGIALKTGQPVKGEEIIIERPDGVRRNVLPHPKPVFGADGKIKEVVNVLVDITEHKYAKEALFESEDMFRGVADQTPMFLLMTNAEMKITYCNKLILDFLGFLNYMELMTPALETVLHPEEGDMLYAECNKAAAEQAHFSLECRFLEAKTRRYKWFLLKGSPREKKKQFAGFVVTAIDIDEQKKVQQELKESVSRTRFLADSMPQKVWTACEKGNVTYLNKPWMEYTGLDYDSLKDWGWTSVVHPDDLEGNLIKWQESIDSGTDFELEQRFRRFDGTYRWHLSRGLAQKDANGKIRMWVGTNTDMDDKKKAEVELIEANEKTAASLLKRDKALEELTKTKGKLEELMNVKEQFLSNMSHEIRTPMNAIVGFTDLILKTPLQPNQRQYIDAIKTSGENLLVIINDILDFSKLEAGKIYFESVNFQISQLISTLTELMLPKSIEKGITLSSSVDKNIPEHLTGDPTRLNQILLNLIGNAIKFTEIGEVRVRVCLLEETRDDVQLVFFVSDTGIGISPEKQTLIFEEFTQAASDTTRKYGGSGLGLAIARKFVEIQGGRITLESRVGEGSTFSFKLRFGKNALPGQREGKDTNEINAIPHLEGLRILLVEDNQLNQILAKKVLTDWGWSVELAENGLIAIEKVEEQDFDIVLMDIQLPEMDGYEATHYIRNKFISPKCTTPIMAMTAHAMTSEELKCEKAGMNGYISKPFNQKLLYSRILHIVHASRRAS